MLLLAAAREELGDLDGAVVGVGPVVAAARAARILSERQPDRVALIGTAGSYAGGPPVGSAIASSRLGMSYGVATLGLGYVPRAPGPIDGDPAMLTALGLPIHTVLTVGAITTDALLADRFSDGWTVEHLEAYAVAFACHECRIPFVAVLGISNTVGSDAHLQWLTNRDSAQQAARDAVRALLG
jgi:nucleoside phosphorylase